MQFTVLLPRALPATQNTFAYVILNRSLLRPVPVAARSSNMDVISSSKLMLRRLKKLLGAKSAEPVKTERRRVNAAIAARPRVRQDRRDQQPNLVDPLDRVSSGEMSLTDAIATDPSLELRLLDDAETSGPGKNVLAERPLYRIESGTYDTLTLVDGGDAKPRQDAEELEGVDPYNTGSFDPPNRWDKSTLK